MKKEKWNGINPWDDSVCAFFSFLFFLPFLFFFHFLFFLSLPFTDPSLLHETYPWLIYKIQSQQIKWTFFFCSETEELQQQRQLVKGNRTTKALSSPGFWCSLVCCFREKGIIFKNKKNKRDARYMVETTHYANTHSGGGEGGEKKIVKDKKKLFVSLLSIHLSSLHFFFLKKRTRKTICFNK